jgi:hypothetical protein
LQADAAHDELPAADVEVTGVSEEPAATPETVEVVEAVEEAVEVLEAAETVEVPPEPVVENAPADTAENSGTDDTFYDSANSEVAVNSIVEEAVPVEPVTEENLPVETAAEEYIPVPPAAPEGAFESIRTRSHSTSFASSLENPLVIETPDLKPEAVIVDESWPVFHARVHKAFSTDASDPVEISDAEESVKDKEKLNGKQWVASQKHVDINKRR